MNIANYYTKLLKVGTLIRLFLETLYLVRLKKLSWGNFSPNWLFSAKNVNSTEFIDDVVSFPVNSLLSDYLMLWGETDLRYVPERGSQLSKCDWYYSPCSLRYLLISWF